MKKFIKENIVLTLGISLPLLLVLLFMVAGTVSKHLVEDPQYDLFFSDGRYSYVEFQVQQQKLYLKVNPARYKYEKTLPRLYRYAVATGVVQEINFQAPDMSKHQILEGGNDTNGIDANIVIAVDPNQLPSEEEAQKTSRIVSQINQNNNTNPFLVPVTEVADVNINTVPTAPDGYQFFNGGYDYSDRRFIFVGAGGSYNNRGAVIRKNGRGVTISYNNAPDSYYSYANFIGWIIP